MRERPSSRAACTTLPECAASAAPIASSLGNGAGAGGGSASGPGAVDATEDHASPLPPVDPDRYLVEGELASGGGGRLLRAIDRRLNRPVAVKLLRRRGAMTEARFFREATVTARLAHPAIVPVYDFGRWTSGEPFYAMKLVAGKTLQELIGAARRLDDRLVLLPHLFAVADAVAYAHSEGVLHRDLKPSNVLVGAFGETLVIDWGIAKPIDGELREGDEPDGESEPRRIADTLVEAPVSPTMTGAVSGTPAYMAPEQARGESVDERCDVYALGAMLYHLLTGAPPYRGTTSREVIAAVLAGPPRRIAAREPGVPRELAAIAERALEREPGARYASAEALAEDLRRFFAGQLVGAHHYSRATLLRRWLGRHRAPVAIGALALAAFSTLGVLSIRRITEERNAAQAARHVAEERRTRLLLEQGRNWLERDPTIALGWIKGYVENGGPELAEARRLATDAVSRGSARHLLRNWTRAVFSPDGSAIAGVSEGRFLLWSAAASEVRVLAPLTTGAGVLEFSPDGKSLLVIDGDRPRLYAKDEIGPPRQLPQLDDAAALASFAPTGETVAIGGVNGGLTLITLADATPRAFAAHHNAVRWIQWTNDGKHLVTTGGDDGTSLFWDVSSGAREKLPVPAAALPVLAPTGDHLAWGGDDGAITLAAIDGSAPRVIGRHKGLVTQLQFSPDGQRLASAGTDRAVRLWPLDGGPARLLTTHHDVANDVRFSRDGQHLFSGSVDRRSLLHDLATDDITLLRGVTARTSRTTFSHDSRSFMLSDAAGIVHVWDVLPSSAQVLRGHDTDTIALTVRDGATLVSFGDDRTLRSWDATGTTSAIVKTPALVGNSIDLGRSGRLVAAAGAENHLWTLDTETGKRCELVGHTAVVNSVAISPDGKELVSGGHDRQVWRWDLASCTGHALGEHPSRIWVVALGSGGSVAAAGDAPTISLWRRDGTRQTLSGHDKTIYDLRFAPDGTSLASVSGDRTLRLWSLAGGPPRVLTGHSASVKLVAFSPDGAWVASGSDDATVRLWRVATGESHVLRHDALPGVLRFSADSTHLVTSAAEVVWVWRAQDALPVAALRGHRGPVVDVAVAPDGTWLASSSQDKTVRRWPMPPDPIVASGAWLASVTSVGLGPDDEVATPLTSFPPAADRPRRDRR